MFRVVPPIIRSSYNCIYSIWYLSHRYCYLPLSWKSCSNTFTIAASSSNSVTNTRCCKYSCMSSWWWVEVPPKTCRAVSRYSGPCSTQRQARELISGPDPAIGARLLSFNRTQSRVVIGLLTGHKTLRRYLHIMGLCNDPICRKCGTEEETSVHILCECEALSSFRHSYLGSFFLDPEDIRELGMRAIWNFAKETGLL